MTAAIATRTLGQPQTADQRVVRSGAPRAEHPAASNREQLAATFVTLGVGVTAPTAHARTLAWYRSKGGAWTRGPS